LVDNAIRHTQKDSNIEIRCTKLQKSTSFEVIDDGDGIPENEIEHIFEDFITIHRSRGDRMRGIGLGLYICKSIVEAHGGWIKAMNNATKGATFYFELPNHQGD
jgi:two-component system sensor histidine kinase KdpD